MYNITPIKNYILFLKNKYGLSITLHPRSEEHLIVSSELMTFNIHDNSYCIYIKTFPEAQKHCIERQYKVLEKCKEGSFCGTCYAGVREYIYPILRLEKTIGFICVSGYKCQNCESYMQETADRFSIPSKNLKETYNSLKDEMPEKTEIDTLLQPLCQMLELAYMKSENEYTEDEHLLEQVLRYIKKNHTLDLTLEDICRQFSCSRSHISHSFKKYTGQNFREYLTVIRLEDAKSLLQYSRLTVTEIAFSVGFGDSNYFSNVFRKYVGMSPLAYRKSVKSDVI